MKRRNLIVRTWLGICLTVLAFGGAAADAPALRVGVVTLDIKSQPIAAALNEFGQQSGVQVLFYSDVANGVRAPDLVGTFTPDEALSQLLSNTGLTYSYVNARTVAIHRVGSTVSERKATRKEAGRPVMRLANHEQISEKPNNEVVQETVGSQEAGRQNSREERRNTRIEEVIVTARKRTERLQDVPVSIAVVSAYDINRRGLVNAADYLRGIPGVNQVDSYQGQVIIMRGIETQPRAPNFRTGTTVATYFGETPTTNSAGQGGGSNVDLKLVDIERVEVLRGPQGTAFGNSSMGGAVQTIPVAPRLDRLEGKVAAGYSSTSGFGGDNYNLQAVGNIPLIKDKLAIRATAYQYQDSGFYRNVAGSDAAFQAAVVTRYGAEAFAIDEDEVGSYYIIGGRIAALFQPSNDLQFTLSLLSQKTETDGVAMANSGIYEQTLLQVAPEHVVRGQKGGLFDMDIDIANAVMKYDFGWAHLLATYSYTKSGSFFSTPFTALGATNWPVSFKNHPDHREHAGEIRLATQLDGVWNFLAGLYAEDLKDEDFNTYLWHGDPATNFFARGERDLGIYGPDRRNLKQKAAFGEASWEFLPGFTLTGGARAYEYDRTFGLDTSGALFGAGAHVREDVKTSGNTFRANLSYKLEDRLLLYAAWSQGFRLGQPQAGLLPSLCDRDADGIIDGTNVPIGSTRQTNPDELDNYEIGGKFALLDRRLTIDAAIFRMEWSDVPVFAPTPTPPQGCGANFLTNAGSARSDGVEFQANLHFTDAFRVDFGGSWIDARLTADVPAQRFSAGDRLPGSPEVSANLSAQYEFGVGGYKAFVRADSMYVGPFYGDVLRSARLRSGDYVKVDATARVAIRNLDIDLFVHNLTNEDAFTFRSTVPSVGEFYGFRLRPRTIGFRLGYTF